MGEKREKMGTASRTVVLTRSPVELHKVLKFENLAASGGEAKFLITEGRVKVNGETETRKHRKIYPGDRIEMAGICLVMAGS